MTLSRDYERFLGGPLISSRDRLHVTINRNGAIFLNAKAYRLIGKPPAVYLYYNRDKDHIVIEPVSSFRLPAAFPLRENLSGWRIRATSFLSHYGIRPDTTVQFARPDVIAGRLHLDLRNTIRIAKPRRKRKKTQNS